MNKINLRFLAIVVAFGLLPGSLSAAGGGEFNLKGILSHHLTDTVIFEWQIGGKKIYQDTDPEAFKKDGKFLGFFDLKRYKFRDADGRVYKYEGGVPLHLTRRVIMMFIVAAVMLAIFLGAAHIISKDIYRVQGRFAGVVEVMVSYLRNDIAEANMHHPKSMYITYIMTAFFFILIANLLGLFPQFGEIAMHIQHTIQGKPLGFHAEPGQTDPAILMIWPGITVTGDIAVTFALALITVIFIYAAGFQYQGPKFILHAVPNGVPWWLFPLMWPIEFIIGPIAKGFALMIRLLANMTAGHVLILVIAGFIFQFKDAWMMVVPISVVGLGFLYVLEIMVAVLQAFIFTLLSAIFIGMSMHRH